MTKEIKNTSYLYFLGGFVEGEGSNSVSISINKNFKFGINIALLVNIKMVQIYYIHLNNYSASPCGSVVEKSGSPDIYVYTLKGYKQIIKHVIPFL